MDTKETRRNMQGNVPRVILDAVVVSTDFYVRASADEEGKAIKMLFHDGKVKDITADVSPLPFHISKKLAHVIRGYTLNEKRAALGKVIIKKYPMLKSLLLV